MTDLRAETDSALGCPCRGCGEYIFLPLQNPEEISRFPLDRFEKTTDFWPAFLGCSRCGLVSEYRALDFHLVTDRTQDLSPLIAPELFYSVRIECAEPLCRALLCTYLYLGKSTTTETALDALRRENFGLARCEFGHAADPLAKPFLEPWLWSDL
jgi:hypothetical protein